VSDGHRPDEPIDEGFSVPFTHLWATDVPETHPITRAIVNKIARTIDTPRTRRVDEEGQYIAAIIAANCVQAIWDLETRIVALEERVNE
jgi:hypothetical protein